MSLNHFLNPNAKNKFCKLKNLKNESDVEQSLLRALMEELGFTADYLETKTTVKEVNIGKRKRKRLYRPDFIGYSDKNHSRPVLVVDAKSPIEDPEDGVADAQLYASVIRRSLTKPKPDQYCIGSNGIKTVVKHYDSVTVEYELDFSDMEDGNPRFEAFKNDMNRISRARSSALQLEPFEFTKPDLDEIKGIFETCHKIIWSKEVTNPQSAFYEFSKLMFVKLKEDKRLRTDADTRKLINDGKPLPRDRVRFSVHWIETNEESEPNPVNTILFSQIRDELELEILRGRKKRMFDKDERIDLKPSTAKEVVRLVEHYDLFGIDEDLNGRLFETFLSATMRGKELGQFFTPRSVVSFMTLLADPQVAEDKVDNIIDACCGTGGFLIEAMAQMAEKVQRPPLSRKLSPKERLNLIRRIRDKQLLGIDLGKNPPVARIARINMYLHGDGGSRIYFADGLDKRVRIEPTLNPELKAEREELQGLICRKATKFKIGLTNPPFAMRYKRDDPDQGLILKEYTLAKNKKTSSIRTSLKSRVMFLERYFDLLEDGGKLVTVMDEAVLNTAKAEPIRRWLVKNFIIKAIISLPRNTFVKAESLVMTSILYLKKKYDPQEPQEELFMAISENVGHTDSGREIRELSDLDSILSKYREFEKGAFTNAEKPMFFIVKGEDLFKNNRTLRLDVRYFDPRYPKTLDKLKKLAKRDGWKLERLGSLLRKTKTKLAGGATPRGAKYIEKGVPFIRIQNVKPNKLKLSNVKHIIRAFHERELKRSQLKPEDVLLTITGSYGISATTPSDFEANINQHVVKLEVDKTRIRSEYLTCFLNTQLCKQQFDRSVTGGTRFALDYDAIKATMILYPTNLITQDEIVQKVYTIQEKAKVVMKEAKEKEEEGKRILKKWDEPFVT